MRRVWVPDKDGGATVHQGGPDTRDSRCGSTGTTLRCSPLSTCLSSVRRQLVLFDLVENRQHTCMPSNIDPLLPGVPWPETAAKAADDLRRPLGAVRFVEGRRLGGAPPSPWNDKEMGKRAGGRKEGRCSLSHTHKHKRTRSCLRNRSSALLTANALHIMNERELCASPREGIRACFDFAFSTNDTMCSMELTDTCGSTEQFGAVNLEKSLPAQDITPCPTRMLICLPISLADLY